MEGRGGLGDEGSENERKKETREGRGCIWKREKGERGSKSLPRVNTV